MAGFQKQHQSYRTDPADSSWVHDRASVVVRQGRPRLELRAFKFPGASLAGFRAAAGGNHPKFHHKTPKIN
jgi:hypothetical protein